jgi:hypothetical protein
MEVKLSERYIRNVIRQHAGLTPISAEAVKIVKEYLDSEAHRIAEAGTKDFLAEVELRKIQKIRPHHRLNKHNMRRGMAK